MFEYDGLEVKQVKEELDEIAQLFRGRKILEIGMEEGGLGSYLKHEYNCSMYGIDQTYHDHYPSIYEKWIIVDSTDASAVEFAQSYAPYHTVIIDGGHEHDQPIIDFLNYHIFAVEAVIFDDINYPNVRKWWDLIRAPYRHKEVVKQKTLWNGLGVLYF
jgi:hypothetical protein